MDIRYGIGIDTPLGPAEAETAVRAALTDEGFGILTEIDVAATLQAKLGVGRAPYRILGACNPMLASQALEVDIHVGLLLPCNVIVYQSGTGSRVEAFEPRILAEMIDDPRMGPIAAEARERLVRALERVAAGT